MPDTNYSRKPVSDLWHVVRPHLTVAASVIGLIALEAVLIFAVMPTIASGQ
ncbi:MULTISPECIES: hypothetical protein [Nocardia]|uniref:hypothetical protein n=1 Tax=Nocardia TaxID=1817 RepID=UPI00130087FF|nr:MULTISPECIES: hypothetical protein [Nocardia]